MVNIFYITQKNTCTNIEKFEEVVTIYIFSQLYRFLIHSITADFQYPRYTCMYTRTQCTVADYFLPRDAAEKLWSFWAGRRFLKSPFLSKHLVPGFLAHSRINIWGENESIQSEPK